MWWGKGSDKEPKEATKDAPKDAAKPSPPATNGPADQAKKAFDPAKLPEPEKLPEALQKLVDESYKKDNFYDELVSGYAPESTESNLRYAAYANRIRTILLSAQRYVAYTSDIGESFRPVAHPNIVRTAYGISWAYILGDVSYEGYKAYWQNQRVLNPQLVLTERQERLTGLLPAGATAAAPGKVSLLDDYRTVMVQRGVFQSIASMGLPAFTIHSIVRYSGQAMKNVKNVRVRTWGPIGLGLAVVPLLPTLFDKPVENAVEFVFHKGFETFGGKEYVGDSPATGREQMLSKRPPVKVELEVKSKKD